MDSNVAIQNLFDSSYFSFIQNGFSYQINPVENGLSLSITNLIFGNVLFQNFPLKTKDFNSYQIKIYPNPNSLKIFPTAQNLIVKKIEVYNTNYKNKIA
jgi:hypothetical protein